MLAFKPAIVALVAFPAVTVAVVHVELPVTRYWTVYSDALLCAFQATVTESDVTVAFTFAGAVGDA